VAAGGQEAYASMVSEGANMSDTANDASHDSGMLELGTLELEAAPARFVQPPKDRRPMMPEPPPVRLVAVEDLRGAAPAGVETALDDFYVTMLQLEREAQSARQSARQSKRGRPQECADEIVYKAENARLRMSVLEAPLPPRADMRPIGVEVRSLADAEAKIIARELEYERLRAIVAGQDTLMLRDPAGNWVALVESREMR
jgi:hypothetical protein